MPLNDAGRPITDAGRPTDAASSPVDPRFDALAEAVLADLDECIATAASVSVWLDEEILWVGGFGSLDPSRSATPPGESTLFMIGSDTKKLTSLSLLRRVEAGRVTLDTTVSQLIPELTMPYATEFLTATGAQLLSNQGDIPSDPPAIPFDPASLDELTGTYIDEDNLGEVIITRSGDPLHVQMPALDELMIPYRQQLMPVSTRVWMGSIQGVDADLAFVDGRSGEMYFRGRGFVATRALAPAGVGRCESARAACGLGLRPCSASGGFGS